MNRSERLTARVLACSTTPRTTQRCIDELDASTATPDDVIYVEAKKCMNDADVDGARALLKTLPLNFKNVSKYQKQCQQYETLCLNGVVRPSEHAQLRNYIGTVIKAPTESTVVSTYAERLVRQGFECTSSATPYTIDHIISSAGMIPEHARAFKEHVDANASFVDVVMARVLACMTPPSATKIDAPITTVATAKQPHSGVKVFASHDWGIDSENHRRVEAVVKRLRLRGINVWFDETHMSGNILDSMCKGMDECDVVLVFVTQNYVNKVRSGNEMDNVRREFMYACSTHANKMVAIRFDASMPRTWSGPVAMQLGTHLHVDMSAHDGEANDARLVRAIHDLARPKRIPTAVRI